MYDENGCCSSCGYTWCAILNSCIRVWETECTNHRRLTRMDDFTIDQLMLFIVGVLGALGGLCVIIQKSKCESCCWGLIKRDVGAVVKSEKLKLTGSTGDTPKGKLDLVLKEPEPEPKPKVKSKP